LARVDTDQSQGLHQLLRIYRIEPLGRLLTKRARLSPAMSGLLFVFLYFGIRLFLNQLVGTPGPATLGDVFRRSPGTGYYPDLKGINYDLIGNPLLLAMLVFFDTYLPDLLGQLEKNGLVEPNPAPPRIARSLARRVEKRPALIWAAVVVPLIVAVAGLGADIWTDSPQNAPEAYSIFLAFLGRYGQTAVFIQIGGLFVILNHYKITPRVHLHHPDQCSGLAPFGRLAIAVYVYLFTLAMTQAIGAMAGGTAFGKIVKNVTEPETLVYLWILFPVVLVFTFDQLLYRPHRALDERRREYLLNASQAWTDYHQRLSVNISHAANQSQEPMTGTNDYHFDDDMELLETWAKLNQAVEQMPTWPIPKRTLRPAAVIANPLIPLLLPFVINAVSNLLT
jgi:hypothetical protein